MKAMIFAAGLGTRLRPLTNNIPKALIRVNGRTMLDRVLEKLMLSGCTAVIINIHYYADIVRKYLAENNNFGMDITLSDETGLLLDTGGGLKKASWFFDDGKPFLVYNADILTDIDLPALYEFHLKNSPVVTLAVQKRATDRLLLFNEAWQLVGWKNALTGTVRKARPEEPVHETGFCGIHVISPEIFSLMKQDGVFSIIETYLNVAGDNSILGYEVKETYWTDIGNRENLNEADRYFREHSL